MRGPIVLALVIASAPMFGVEAQAASFQIRLRARGPGGPLPCADPGGISDDVFTGKVTGDESELASSQEIVYRGVLERKSNLLFCDASRSPGSDEDRLCWMQISGGGKMNVELTIPADGVHTYVKLEPIRKSMHVDQSPGDCDQELAAGIVETYLTGGEGADIQCAPKAPMQEKTKCAQPSSGHGDPPGPWTLEVLDRQGLKAIPGGPYPIQRAATVTLDGSRSTPESGHTIQTYSWDLTPLGTPDGCAGIGAPKTMTGVTVSFVGLCSVKAKLTVTQEDGAVDAQETVVTVSPRAWGTKLTTDPTPRFQNFTFVANGFVFGYNRCARNGHFDEENNHWYEPRAGSTTDYEEGTYWLDQVTDDGPFSEIFFVSQKDFDVKRGFWVNKKLSRTGDVYDLNPGAERSVANCSGLPAQCKFGKPVIERLEASVEAHENFHSELAKAAVAGAKDPAIGVEKSLGSNRAALKKSVNLLVTTAVSDMTLASSEENVKAKMRNGPFKDGGCIDFPAWDGAIKGCYFHFVTFADKGERDMAP